VAVGAGVLIACACLFAFSLSLDRLAAYFAGQDVELAAKSKLSLAENRIGRVVATLDELGKQSVESCTATHLDNMRKAVFANVLIKEMSVIGPDGTTWCATWGFRNKRTPISSTRAPATPSLAVELVSFGEVHHRVLRIRRAEEGVPGLGALLLASTLIAQNSGETTADSSGYARLQMPDGSLIGEAGSASDVEPDTPLSTRVTSGRYGLTLTVVLPRSVLAMHKSRLVVLTSVIAAGLGLLLLVSWMLGPMGHRDNPIAELEHALKAGEFVPYYQPIMDLVTGKLRGAEVLVRWRKPDGSVVSPAAFVPLAESSGIIVDITHALMHRVCDELGPAFDRRPHLKVSFNLAARHFEDDNIVRDVRDIFGRGRVRLSQLILEVTERQPIENLVKTRHLIATLQGLGVRMALDDVGTGHSGLSYILKLGVDIIKIDKMFVDAIGIERSSTAIIETLIDLAHNMRMDIVAEGVETFEQVVALRDRGIRAAQGFVFAPPLPGASFLQLIEAVEPLPCAEAANAVSAPAAA
jgi:sensor c-di-GMP phosphodiesterase-like protein